MSRLESNDGFAHKKEAPDLYSEEMEKIETSELLSLYKATGDETYKWAFVLRYQNVIKKVALQFRGIYSHFTQVDDIISEGVLTLSNAIDKFDPEKGVKFETYVSKRIRGMIIDIARKQDWLPRNLRKRTKEIDIAVTELFSRLGRYPTDSEIAEKLGISTERYQKDAAGVALGNVLSLDAMLDMNSSESGYADIPSKDEKEQPEAVFQEQEFKKMLAEGIKTLKQNEQIVLSLYYEKNLHMTEIAQIMEVSSPRVSQIHACAVTKLQDYMKAYINDETIKKGKKRGKE